MINSVSPLTFFFWYEFTSVFQKEVSFLEWNSRENAPTWIAEAYQVSDKRQSDKLQI